MTNQNGNHHRLKLHCAGCLLGRREVAVDGVHAAAAAAGTVVVHYTPAAEDAHIEIKNWKEKCE